MKFKFLSLFRIRKSQDSFHTKAKKVQKTPTTFGSFLNTASKGLSISTKQNYETAVRSFIRFSNGKDISLAQLSSEYIKAYERWMRDNNVCLNTSSCYLRSLRAIYNKAVLQRKIKDYKPFDKAFTGNEKTAKRCITENEIRKIKATGINNKSFKRKLTCDLFLFSFYAMGMPFVDMANLRQHQIKDGILTYYRRKTGKQVRVKIEQCMQDIILRYTTEKSDYVFPILYKIINKKIRKRTYSTALNLYNQNLKRLAHEANIGVALTSYISRHSWASIAYSHNVELPVISQAMGHTDTQTTLIYINEIGDKQIAQANHKVLEEIFSRTLGKRCYTFLKTMQR
ncbi:site-specific integrase [Prevotella sp. HUN102]|uniref:tyrosine-type recombinase/integrase n=1 Tax=Prevotella sp. HUN102 TaxID=1392486 RepID=UPI00056C3D1F|nr:site-specific integrase [Prevotella sp. HUN102]